MGGKTLVLSPRLREKKGLWLMTIIARRFCEKKPAYSLSELEKLTTLSSENLEELLDILEEGGFIVEVAGDKDSFTMAGDVSKILVSEILFCLLLQSCLLCAFCEHFNCKNSTFLYLVWNLVVKV